MLRKATLHFIYISLSHILLSNIEGIHMAYRLASSRSHNRAASKKFLQNKACLAISCQWGFNLTVSMSLQAQVSKEAAHQYSPKEYSRSANIPRGRSSVHQSNQQRRRQGKQTPQASRLVGRSEPSYVFHRNNRKQQASIFCGSIPQHKSQQHQGIENQCYVRWTFHAGVQAQKIILH
jgi:hypothetical protein